MSLRKVAGLLVALGLVAGLIQSGVAAQFTDSVTAQQNINVGTFSCVISDGGGGVISNNGHSVTYSDFTIMSSAPGSDPISFTVQNTGSIPDVLTVSTSAVSAPFSIIGAPFAAVPLASNATHTYNTGVQWGTLDNSNLGQTGSVTWTVNCGENAPTAIFNNTPAVMPSNLPSWGPEAYAYNEWGAGVTFAGTARKLSTATVIMSSWACQSGGWSTNDCVTTPGATFNVPITFNVYNMSGGNVGSLIATQTQTFAIPYRPSYDSTHCTGGRWYDGTTCFSGKATSISFTFSGQSLPNTAVFGITFNTDNYGYSHIGGSSSPTDSLNIATYPGTDLNGATAVAAVGPGSWLPSDNLESYASTGSTPTAFIGSSPSTSFNAGGFGPFGSLLPAVQITATN